ncbi:hypothetical protein IMSAGC018_01324 [Lachnospiraceae bacterium]|nr:hypothetical protein IMSAGC018_01324 [Lachnospiraceae bacterium]
MHGPLGYFPVKLAALAKIAVGLPNILHSRNHGAVLIFFCSFHRGTVAFYNPGLPSHLSFSFTGVIKKPGNKVTVGNRRIDDLTSLFLLSSMGNFFRQDPVDMNPCHLRFISYRKWIGLNRPPGRLRLQTVEIRVHVCIAVLVILRNHNSFYLHGYQTILLSWLHSLILLS